MTVYVKTVSVISGIAALSISGVTILDTNQIPSNGAMLAGTMYPNVRLSGGVISGASPKRVTLGIDGAEKVELSYGLSYRYLHSIPSGNIGDIYNALPGLISAYTTIMTALIGKDKVAGAEDIFLKSVSDVPIIVHDVAGHPFWGCDFTFSVVEFCEVAP